jgi:hypothetical protein
MSSTLTITKRTSAQLRVVVRGRIELPAFRFSAPDIPAVTPVLGGKSGVAAAR